MGPLRRGPAGIPRSWLNCRNSELDERFVTPAKLPVCRPVTSRGRLTSTESSDTARPVSAPVFLNRRADRSHLQSGGHLQTDRRVDDDGSDQAGEVCVLDPDCVNVSTRIEHDLRILSQ